MCTWKEETGLLQGVQTGLTCLKQAMCSWHEDSAASDLASGTAIPVTAFTLTRIAMEASWEEKPTENHKKINDMF